MKYKIGDVVHFKADKKRMVVVAVLDEKFIKCRYRNEITGIYEIQEFRIEEFEEEHDH